MWAEASALRDELTQGSEAGVPSVCRTQVSVTAELPGRPAEWLGGRWRSWEHGEDLALILSEGDSEC